MTVRRAAPIMRNIAAVVTLCACIALWTSNARTSCARVLPMPSTHHLKEPRIDADVVVFDILESNRRPASEDRPEKRALLYRVAQLAEPFLRCHGRRSGGVTIWLSPRRSRNSSRLERSVRT